MGTQPRTTTPGLTVDQARTIIDVLADRLVSTLDLQLALKHIHWNVVGPNFISAHEMLDEHVREVRAMSDDVAERIATLGGTPNGNPGAIVERRRWADYPLGRDSVFAHFTQLDSVYDGVIADHRAAIETVGEIDPITEDLLIGHTARLELYQWFIRSFYERADELEQPVPELAGLGGNGHGESDG